MVFKGCERSVITYSSLISACEKAGQSDLALELFAEMAQEGCVPNTVTYNSLITACAQGAPRPPPLIHLHSEPLQPLAVFQLYSAGLTTPAVPHAPRVCSCSEFSRTRQPADTRQRRGVMKPHMCSILLEQEFDVLAHIGMYMGGIAMLESDTTALLPENGPGLSGSSKASRSP